MKIFVSATKFKVAKNQIRLNLCDFLWRQNSVAATKIFTKFSNTHEVIRRCRVSPRHVATTCRLMYRPLMHGSKKYDNLFIG